MGTKKPQSVLQRRSTGSYRVVGAGKRSALTGRYIVDEKPSSAAESKGSKSAEALKQNR